jgi:hypothetical protein
MNREDDHIDALTEMILGSKKEEEELAQAIQKILEWVDEKEETYEYGIYEVLDPTGDNALQDRLVFLNQRGKEGWILCTEVLIHDPMYGRCTRYTFRKKC